MPSQTTERSFETYVEEILLTRGGWKSGSNAEWDQERARFPAQVFAFIQDTQPKLWAEMKALHAAGLEALLLNALVKELDAKGSLHVLRHGFKFYGKTNSISWLSHRLASLHDAQDAKVFDCVVVITDRQWQDAI